MGTTRDQITAAIGAHGAWKRRLADAIATGRDASTPDRIRLDNTCDFGKWLYGAGASLLSDPHYAEVKRLHADFHREAAVVLTLALAGRKPEALAAMGTGTAFARASSTLTTKMMAWSGDAA